MGFLFTLCDEILHVLNGYLWRDLGLEDDVMLMELQDVDMAVKFGCCLEHLHTLRPDGPSSHSPPLPQL